MMNERNPNQSDVKGTDTKDVTDAVVFAVISQSLFCAPAWMLATTATGEWLQYLLVALAAHWGGVGALFARVHIRKCGVTGGDLEYIKWAFWLILIPTPFLVWKIGWWLGHPL